MTPGLPCGQVQQLVQRTGAIVLSTGTYTYDRYVRDLSFCQLDEMSPGRMGPGAGHAPVFRRLCLPQRA